MDSDALYLAWEEHQGGNDYRTNYDVFYRTGIMPETKKLIYLPLVLRSG